MKKNVSICIFSICLLLMTLFSACDNPLFVNATGLYKVEFSTNGGTSIESYRTAYIKELPYTAKTDCSFAGWYLNSDFSGEALSFPLQIKKDTTLYARWLQKFTVNFVVNGGDEIESYKTGLIETAPDTSRTNYVFAGWYLKSDFMGEPIVFPFAVTKPTTLYAKWIATYNVTFVTNGGSELSSYRSSEIETAPITEREGFSFMGWYKDSEFTQKIEFPYTLLEDTIFYAKWQQNFNVAFVTNGGSSVASLFTGLIEIEPVSTKTDASLEGWYLTEDFIEGTKVIFPYVVTSATTLYAKWQPVQCTVSYYANGAISGTVPQSVKVNKGSSYIVSGNTGNLSKTGYAFTKWSTTSNGDGGASYSAGQSITVSADVNLYAQWGKDYAAMVYVNGGTFTQGIGTSTDSSNGYAGPAHSVTLSSFSIGQYEVTYELWIEIKTWASLQENSWNIGTASKGVTANDKYTDWEPATNVSWYEAITWCNAYSEMKGLTPCYYSDSSYTTVYRDYSDSGYVYWKKSANGYRLPTETEWEYAAKGGDNQKSFTYAGSNTIGDVAWYYYNSGSETHPVGTKKSNSIGLYDMTGNVCEWCGTSKYSYSSDSQANPNSWIFYGSSSVRFNDPIYRGGSWYDGATAITYRGYAGYGDVENNYIGFRVACN